MFLFCQLLKNQINNEKNIFLRSLVLLCDTVKLVNRLSLIKLEMSKFRDHGFEVNDNTLKILKAFDKI